MDFKWIAVIAVGCTLIGGVAGTAESYFKSECRQSYAQSNKTAEEIKVICR